MDKDDDSPVVEQFIARKADLLFAPLWTSTAPAEDESQEGSKELYAVMPPLEQFMEVPYEDRRDFFYRDVERGDMVIGRITSIRDFGFFVNLICTAGGLERDIEDLEITGLCPVRDVPSSGIHDDPLSYFQVGDLIRAGVKDVDRYHEKLTISLCASSLAPKLNKIKLGVISKEDLPLHYIRGEKAASDSGETYERLLKSSLGFSNPSSVDYLLGKLGIIDTKSSSLMRGLQSKHFKEEDFASAIRKKQSASWALKCVKAGVDHFKSGRHVEAMNEYNKALEIDTNNVEALVARGALYATKGSLVKAIGDFELALDTCPTHRNAKKYLCQTLVERGGQLEEEEKLVTAEGLYKKAIALDGTFQEAEDALRKLQALIQKTLKRKAEEAAREEKPQATETSAEKLRKILKEEKRMKKKRRRSDSSSVTASSSDSSTDDSAPSSSRKKSKKRKHKRRRSSRSSKKRKRRVSYRDDRTAEDEEDLYPLPANTSASFIDHKQALARLIDEEGGDERGSHRKSRADDSRGRSEDSRPSRSPQADGRKGRGQSEDRPEVSGLFGVNGRYRGAYGERRRSDDSVSSQQEESGSLRLSVSRKDSLSSAYSENSRKTGRAMRDVSWRAASEDGSEGGGFECRQRDREDYGSNGRPDGKDRRLSSGDGSRPSAESQKKDLPANLLNIFNQIADFEKERKQKK
ncbi:tetratricopeptide repeat protein 14 isoform X2 [Brachyhypopomus gauderio]|uniref:tetratricopeptide repeat protein 14 isoform X2 n=1 Tax=Brachyhypopomus gauderio TaxID=698409 RepID=UPI00404123AB